ncbi:unnamed protein product [Acanthosepion pharaonis]|uniref:Uncharacterized protein n=1 Tax=Acanthosepion pharaonis TaxID=158019 RepID=A0A812APC2_ACAPH|nr:unnamed protein product [Sepia pharaonis]
MFPLFTDRAHVSCLSDTGQSGTQLSLVTQFCICLRTERKYIVSLSAESVHRSCDSADGAQLKAHRNGALFAGSCVSLCGQSVTQLSLSLLTCRNYTVSLQTMRNSFGSLATQLSLCRHNATQLYLCLWTERSSHASVCGQSTPHWCLFVARAKLTYVSLCGQSATTSSLCLLTDRNLILSLRTKRNLCVCLQSERNSLVALFSDRAQLNCVCRQGGP